MKDLKDLVLEAKLKKSRDPFDTLANALAQCVTHYQGYGNAGKYTAAPAGKSGLDGDQLEDVKAALRNINGIVDCEKEKLNSDQIYKQVEKGDILIYPYVYDKFDNGKKGYIGFVLIGSTFELSLTNGYFNFHKRKHNKHSMRTFDSFCMDMFDFAELLEATPWPDEKHFTNVSNKEEFEKALKFIIDDIEGC